jgi:glycosyltransferase involved in cell wall biosynthesis
LKQIVIDGRMILPHMSGIGRYLIGLCRGLIALEDDLEYELWLQKDLPPTHPARTLAGRKLKLVELPVRHMSLFGQVRIPYELVRHAPDLYHYPHFDLPWSVPGPVVATIHDLKYLARPDFFPRTGNLKRLMIRKLLQHTCTRSNRIICDSRSTADDLTRQMKVSQGILRVIPLGIEERFFKHHPESVLQSFCYRMGLERPFLLYVGERRPHKNLVGVIRAFEQFQLTYAKKYRLVIAGKPYANYTVPEKLVQQAGLAEQVIFLDYIPDEDLPFLYQSADVFVLLSYYEGFGFPILEAMASGLPVVTSDCTSLPEVAGEAALIIPPDDPERASEAISQVISGGLKREEYIQRGSERAQEFTWEYCAHETRQVYHEVIGQ